MKQVICAALFASLLAVPLAATETPSADKSDKAMAEQGHHRAAGFMKKKLGLSDEQAKKLETSWQERRKAVKPLMEQLRTALKKVHGELEIGASDKDIQAALDQVEKTRGAIRAAAEQSKKTMDSILTPTQRAKMLVMREKMMRHGMAMGLGRKGFGRGHEGHEGSWRGYEHSRQGCESGRHGEGDHEGWRGEERGERFGHEGWGQGHDHEKGQEDDDE
jgi:Spy/CpxP family protein refolding chaperone